MISPTSPRLNVQNQLDYINDSTHHLKQTEDFLDISAISVPDPSNTIDVSFNRGEFNKSSVVDQNATLDF